MTPKVLNYESPQAQYPYKMDTVELHLTEVEARLFRHLLDCSKRADIKALAHRMWGLAMDAGFAG